MKIVALADYAVNKTQIILQFIAAGSTGPPQLHVGTFTKGIEIDGYRVILGIRDPATRPQFRGMLPPYVAGVHGAALIYDVTSSKSFESIGGWLEFLWEYAPPHIAIIHIGHTPDPGAVREVSFEEGKRFAERKHLLFIETSGMDATNTCEAFRMLAAEVIRRSPNLHLL
jgi:GTPase SAR1 family protein